MKEVNTEPHLFKGTVRLLEETAFGLEESPASELTERTVGYMGVGTCRGQDRNGTEADQPGPCSKGFFLKHN